MKKFVITLAMVVVLISLMGMPPMRGNLPAAEKNLFYATPVDIMSVDPHQASGSNSMIGVHPFYDTLVTLKGGTTEPCPGAAESWSVSRDGKTITFRLRRNAKFHDGTPLTAEDVKFTFARLLNTHVTAQTTVLGKWTSEDMLEVVDAHTFKLGLRKKSDAIFSILTSPWYGIMSKDYVTKHATKEDPLALKWMFNHECGSGPWELVEWRPNEKIVYKRFKDYWGDNSECAPIPKTDTITVSIIKDPSTMVMMLQKGDLDIAHGLEPDQYERLKTDPNINVIGVPSFDTAFILINTSRKPFDNLKVRQALNHAINYDELIKYVERGNALRLYSAMPEGMWGKNYNVPKYNYDPKKAKELLKEAGYPNGFETTILYSQERYTPFEQASVYIQAYLDQVGIKAKLKKVAWPTQLDTMKAANFDLALQVWLLYYPDPSDILWYFYNSTVFKAKGWNFSFWDNAKTTELTEKAGEAMDRKERDKLYQEVDRIGVENAVYVWLYQMKKMLATRKNISGVVWAPTLRNKQFGTVDKK